MPAIKGITTIKCITVAILLLVLLRCTSINKHKSAEEVYKSGIITATDFILIGKNDKALVDTYYYKYDSALIVRLHYWNNRNEYSGLAFYYHGRPEGKWYLYEQDGSLKGEVNYMDGKENGPFLVYDEGKLISKMMYENGKMIYYVNYENGRVVDSTALQ